MLRRLELTVRAEAGRPAAGQLPRAGARAGQRAGRVPRVPPRRRRPPHGLDGDRPHHRCRTSGRPSPTGSWRPGWWSTCRPASTSAPPGARSATWPSPRSPRSAHLTGRGGNRFGALLTTGERLHRFPAQSGRRAHHRAAAQAGADPALADAASRGDLAAALEALRRPPRRRGLAVVISDFLGDLRLGAADAGARRAARRARDRGARSGRARRCPPSGCSPWSTRRAASCWRCRPARRSCASSTQAAASEQRAEIAAALRRAGAGHLQLRTDRDWLRRHGPVRRRRGGAAPSGGALR